MMMKRYLLIACLLAAPSISAAQNKIPQFKDYPIEAAFNGKHAPVKLTKDNRSFRTRLREAAAKGKPDFAGRYIVAIWGCGTSCLGGAVIDAKTGDVAFLPGAVNSWEGDENLNPIEYRLNSRLIVFSGLIDQDGLDTSGLNSHYYEFKNGEFIYIKTIKRKSSS